jgi:SAM-dependent methyltransferase
VTHRFSELTIAHYDRLAEAYWDGTREHDVSENYTALLDAIEGDPPYSILDLGCGPGRDLHHFRSLGHDAVGLDGSKEFVAMARSYSGCEVLHQDFLAMVLPKSRFDGVFANASLFHVPSQELPRVLLELSEALRPWGVLFCSNPRGNNEEGLNGDRYCCFFDLDTWRNYVSAAGFFEVRHFGSLNSFSESRLASITRAGIPCACVRRGSDQRRDALRLLTAIGRPSQRYCNFGAARPERYLPVEGARYGGFRSAQSCRDAACEPLGQRSLPVETGLNFRQLLKVTGRTS